jgi:dethiobiotin synthase
MPSADPRAIFITGTDTDVGKTMVSAALLAWLQPRCKVPVRYLKPLQTGCTHVEQDSDPAWVRRVTGASWSAAAAVHTCLPAPKAPSIAAAEAKITIDPQAVTAWVRGFAGLCLVEGAGGIRVPIAPGWTMLEFAEALGAPCVVVARAGLGTINHTVLTLEALQRASLPCLGVVFCDPADAVPHAERQENAAAICELTGVPVLGTLGRVADFPSLTRRPPAVMAELGARVLQWAF